MNNRTETMNNSSHTTHRTHIILNMSDILLASCTITNTYNIYIQKEREREREREPKRGRKRSWNMNIDEMCELKFIKVSIEFIEKSTHVQTHTVFWFDFSYPQNHAYEAEAVQKDEKLTPCNFENRDHITTIHVGFVFGVRATNICFHFLSFFGYYVWQIIWSKG